MSCYVCEDSQTTNKLLMQMKANISVTKETKKQC